MLNNALKVIAILLGVLWTIAAIPPVINTYYYLDELHCTDDGCDNYEIWTDEDEILEDLLPKNISTQVFKALLENAASEQGSRMTAMDNATRNAGDLVDKLTINYNRSRQASITKELIEIISGAESL